MSPQPDNLRRALEAVEENGDATVACLMKMAYSLNA